MRSSGILMHITSLPGPYGVGTMGKPAYDFVDFLHKAGQHHWQILPLTPTGYGDSPYQSCSTYAGNHYLIDLEMLVKDGLLDQSQLDGITWSVREDKTDFGILYNNRLKILGQAYTRFVPTQEFDRFCEESAYWLPDFALFMALKEESQGKSWYQWEAPLKYRDPQALHEAWERLSDRVGFYCFVQYLFYQQWHALQAYAHKKEIQIIGDVPIYVPYDSVEVWCNPRLFQLDESLTPTAVAGCPPDAFTEDGQLWGNPLYRWERHAQEGYGWWIHRLQAASRLYDVIRIDHFRGFEAYWAVPYGDSTARNGKWIKGPGLDFIRAIQNALPHVGMIAEDLGFLTQEVLDLRDDSGLPGMKVLEFAFYSRDPSDYLPYLYPKNSVCYTGTHDNMTMRQWFDESDPEVVEYATEYMALTKREGLVWGVIRTAMSSVSDLCVVQMQDYLNLGGEARMNFPGTQTDANWTWRLTPGHLTNALAAKIKRLTVLYGRHQEIKS